MSDMIEVNVGGHITLLFTIDTSARLPRSQGSRGAGFTVDHGVKLNAQLIKKEEALPLERMNGIAVNLSDDPRSSLAAGLYDAEQAILNLELVSSLK